MKQYPIDDILKLREALNTYLDEDGAELRQKQAKVEADLQELINMLPKVSISEEWGREGSVERQEFIHFFDALIKGRDPVERVSNLIKSVSNIETSRAETTYSNNFSKIIFLNTLYRIVNSFSSSAAGWIFEALLSVIVGGHQVTQKDTDGQLEITDVEVGGKSYSAKLIAKGKHGSRVKGSIKNLKDTVIGARKPVTYIIAERLDDATSIRFSSFEVVTPADMEYIIGISEPAEVKKGQFKFVYGKLQKDNALKYNLIGQLSISKEHIAKVAQQHLFDIVNQIKPLYTELNLFTRNLYTYFSADQPKTKNTVAQITKQSAQKLDSTTQKVVK